MRWIPPWFKGSPATAEASGRGQGWERACLAAGEAMGERYSRCDPAVSPRIDPLTREEARDRLAEGFFEAVQRLGPTKVGTIIGGCDESSVRDARDKKSVLRLDYAWNLLLVDGHALDPIARHFRKRLVDLDPRPVDWDVLGIAAIELGAEIMRCKAKGHVSHLDQPKLKALARRVADLSQGAA